VGTRAVDFLLSTLFPSVPLAYVNQPKALVATVAKHGYQYKDKSYVTTDGRSTSLLVSHLGPQDQIFVTVLTVAGLLVWGALFEGRTGLSYKIVAGPIPAQSFSGLIPAGLMTIFYCLIIETLPTWRVRSPSPRNRVTTFYCFRFETLPTWRARYPVLYPSRNRMATFYCLIFETLPTWRVRYPHLYHPGTE
jgi:hypothetical protein